MPLSLIGMTYRFKQRSTVCLPYWLAQGVDMHICMTYEDPDGTAVVLWCLNNVFPGRLNVHVFDCHPLQRAHMYHKVIQDIDTEYTAFFDVDNVPPPDFVEKALVQLLPLTAVGAALSAPRIDLSPDLVVEILEGKVTTYDEMYAKGSSHPIQSDTGNEFVGYFQMAKTEDLRRASPDTDRVGVNDHDMVTQRILKENGVALLATETRPLLHLTHTRYHREKDHPNL